MATRPEITPTRPSASRPQDDIDAFIARGRESEPQPDRSPSGELETRTNATGFALKTAPPRGATKRLAMELPIDLHTAMKTSCVARNVTMTEEVIALLRSVYTPDWNAAASQ